MRCQQVIYTIRQISVSCSFYSGLLGSLEVVQEVCELTILNHSGCLNCNAFSIEGTGTACLWQQGIVSKGYMACCDLGAQLIS